MGFSSLIDILGSIVIGGLLFMILLRINDSAVKNTYTFGGDLIVQQNLVEVVQLVEHDFRQIGYCQDWSKIPDPTKAIIYADTSRIKFQTDINNDGQLDTLSYYIGPVSDLASTANPRDRFLYRVENHSTPFSANLGVTQFYIVYYNSAGEQLQTPVSVPGSIASMQINITVENVNAYDRQYSSAFWRQIRLAARNLGNR